MASPSPTEIKSELNLGHESSQSLDNFISPEDFQCTIRNRKNGIKEIRMEMIRHGRELVAERNSMVENDYLLKHFPKEICALIMCQLACLPDVYQRILFPYVLQQFFESSAGKRSPHDSINLNQATTFRGVCKSSRNAVDRFYEGKIISCIHGGDRNISTYSVKFLQSERSLDRVIQLFCTGPEEFRAKRFFHRSLEFRVTSDFLLYTQGERTVLECFEDFSFKTMRLLEVVGDQIWHFNFKIWETEALEENGIPLSQILMILKSMVSSMPNLKWLDVDMGSWSSSDYQAAEDAQFFRLVRSFPILKDLEKLDYCCNGDRQQNMEILTSLLRSNPQIKSVFFFPSTTSDEATRICFQPLFQSLPPKVTGFHLSWFKPIPLQLLQPLVHCHSTLSSLTVVFDDDVCPGAAFSFINCFPALESLHATFSNPSIGRNIIPMLKLAKLRKCIVTLCQGKVNYAEGGKNVLFFYNLQFLLPCKKLQSLQWTNWFTDIHLQHFLVDNEPQGNMIDFKGGHWDLNSSNIWRVFPELRDINVRLDFTNTVPNRHSSTYESFVLDKAYRKFCAPQVKKRTLESHDSHDAI